VKGIWLYAVFRVFAYLKRKHNSRLVFNPSNPELDLSALNLNVAWSEFYGDVQEVIPSNAPPPRGKPVVLQLYVDADHAGDQVTRRSRSGCFQMVNNATIAWFSEKQSSVERSTFGSEFVALSVALESN
jgi:hypothetical protein